MKSARRLTVNREPDNLICGGIMKKSNSYRIETDTMGKVKVPAGAYYGAQTQRAVENFPISDLRFQRSFIKALGLIKYAAAEVNWKLKLLDGKISSAIKKAAQEVMDGKLDSQFVVDIFQTGSGTSTNMNANEVISNRAIEILRGKIGSKIPVHPNDHVNKGQSSNDVIPTAIHIAAVVETTESLIPALEGLHKAVNRKAKEFHSIIKIGRTHLQDATPIRLGQEFSGYARQIELGIERAKSVLPRVSELALGGSAVGTGINVPKGFARKCIQIINKKTGCRFTEAKNHFEAQGARDSLIELSGALKTVAVGLSKIANDIRWLGSGPRCGLGELALPDTQPGSSIMPGKVNPVIAESLIQACVQVIGNDITITYCGQGGNFELNVMMPVMAYNLLQSIEILSNSVVNFRKRLIEGLKANADQCKDSIEKSLAMVTSLAPEIGYDKAAALAKKAFREGKTIREVVQAEKILPDKKLSKLLDPKKMV